MSDEGGGTKIQRRAPPPQQIPPQQMQMPPPPQQQMQMPPQQMVPPQNFQNHAPVLKRKLDSNSMKSAIVVVLIFLMLNSKIVWSQISRLPFMGSVEPSLIALIINSILAGVIFYCFKTFVFKD